MGILKDVIAELFGMFVADARLTAAILAVVAIAALAVDMLDAPPLAAGAILLVGCVATLIGAVLAAARGR